MKSYKDTLNLPRTDFPMKANLANCEPAMLKHWQDIDLYSSVCATFKGRPKYIFHDDPPYANGDIHIGHVVNKVLIVHHGTLGRSIGTPTANIHAHRKATPISGIHAVEAFGLESEPPASVANVSTRPTVGGTRTLFEVHLFDFDDDIYGRYLDVNFLHKLRDEEKFDSLKELQERMYLDLQEAREFFDDYYPRKLELDSDASRRN